MSHEWVRSLEAVGPLQGEAVRLEPLATSHHEQLCDVALDGELWRWTVSLVSTPAELAAYIDGALQQRAQGTAFPYAIIDAISGRAVGSTRLGAMDMANRRVEIGWTWVARARQRSPVNTEAKYLLLRTAFQQLGCVRVEFKTDLLNLKSRRALTRIGAVEEGILRQHMITASGRLRDTVYYSILDSEWPQVKQALQQKLRSGQD